jgi:hypothetical protein
MVLKELTRDQLRALVSDYCLPGSLKREVEEGPWSSCFKEEIAVESSRC